MERIKLFLLLFANKKPQNTQEMERIKLFLFYLQMKTKLHNRWKELSYSCFDLQQKTISTHKR